MKKNNFIYIITNSFPEKKETFNTHEFEYVLKNYKNIKILSFSRFRNKEFENNRVIKLKITDGIKELIFPKEIKNMSIHFKMFRYIKSKNIIEFGKNLYSYILALSTIRNVELKKDDMIFSYWLTRSSLIAYYLNKLIGIKYICQGHGSDIYINPPEKLKEILDNSELLITVGDKNKKYVSKKYNIPEEKIKVFRLGVSKNFYEKLLKVREKEKYTHRENNKKIKFLTVAMYKHVKGIDLLLKAINLLVNSQKINHNVEFSIFGEGKKFKFLQNYVKKYNLNQYVNLNGWIDRENLTKELVKADCFILPSRSEGLPVVLMEACAASLPIIATNVGSVSEIAIDGYNAILCEANPESISESIYTFINLDREKIKQFSDNSFSLYINNYLLENNLKSKYTYIESIFLKNISNGGT
ncbi:glycosyltransferase family 4 protein [Thermosipho atlanticus]|uniref:Glycosyltransferase involved in cell wall bisynthesis n=1 Tax=Thermosipho atlanticus DSM 15807 TaxID=1123380 RepID=A0A1M5RPC9_9BACT|nr:glycosyltransferase family 4 protein [Thermosipho atlanticus]SHH27958.1 Glycosyltransferase involved in cell wall bisynthesis [Thermosipho atlanticus DSM 15807]